MSESKEILETSAESAVEQEQTAETAVDRITETSEKKSRRRSKKIIDEVSGTTLETGGVFETSLILLYNSSAAPKHFRGIKGKFYIWNDEIVNGRIRLTDSPSGVGRADRIIGWVNISDIKVG
ncbi:MAG: hypothetical protein NC320_03180 [Clostridium sp.]|nr:hypothetical protein [Clostridium sp.]